MYIKKIILDGFKSYGRRTEVDGFDPEFTAITGLNGSGKSNILDSICFVLGISNLVQVRATSLTELVYLSGQSNVKKAIVTVVFDNSNPHQCPLGYEKCKEISIARQVEVGGKNKYFINGKTVLNKKVSDFFCSIQLNVNNPNFLIMQGRITKVLNMKPHEILSMIEEAAGTSMYESKREATTKLIDKKEAKVRETNALLEEEIKPKLEKLRQEHSLYKEYQKTVREIDYLTRIVISDRYVRYEASVKNHDVDIQKVKDRIEACKKNIQDNNEECTRLEEQGEMLRANLENQEKEELDKIEAELKKLQHAESTTTGKLKAEKELINSAEKNLKFLEKGIQDDKKALQKKEDQMSKVHDMFQGLKDADARDTAAYEAAKKRFEATSQGLLTTEDGQAASLQDQLISAKKQLSESDAKIKIAGMELAHNSNLLKQKENETQANDAAYTRDDGLRKQIEAKIAELEKQLQQTNYEEGRYESLTERRSQLQRNIRSIKQELDNRNAFAYELRYQDPEPNFDRSKVRGMVGKLLTLRDPKTSLALSMAGGGSIRSFITDDDVTSKKILQKGQLRDRVTIIPINKIRSRPIDRQAIEYAQNLVGKENVQSAISLIDFDPYYTPVMNFVFGSTLIARNLDIAKKVTYHERIRCRTVTLEGDVVDPEGTLSGGAAPKGQCFLDQVMEIKKLEKEMRDRNTELRKVEQDLISVEKLYEAYGKVQRELELRQHDLNGCKTRLAQSSYQQLKDEIESLKESVVSLKKDIETAGEAKKLAEVKVKDIQEKLSDAEGYRKRELKAATDALKEAKIKSEESRKNWKKHEEGFETLKIEIEDLKSSIQSSMEELGKKAETIANDKAEFERKCAENSELSKKVAELKSHQKEQKEKMDSKNVELKNLAAKKSKLQSQNSNLVLEIKKKENDVIKMETDSESSKHKLRELEKKHTWILEDRSFFGAKNTRYDYSSQDPEEAAHKLNDLRQKKDKMERNVNTRAMTVLEHEEQEYERTMQRKRIVEQDKMKIQNIICKMDEKCREQVDKAWQEVNHNFGSIFSTLLQGAQARLQPVKQGNNLVGLEIKVGFNGVWKESLGELSGGQRSLVALSLVLAMLKFSPAPLYILDEVDAALDMSHTQNIGSMLKTHFTSSQFIIVSLKEGMFTNANVLFNTKFVDGISTVSRSVGKSK